MTVQITIPNKRESTDERRLAIALAARALIVEKGFEGLRTRDIAERVGINIATLHYHVPTKKALIQLVAQTIERDFRQQEERRPRKHLPAIERLRIEFDDQRETLVDNPALVVAMSELMQRARRDPDVAQILQPLYDSWILQLTDIVTAGRADGSFRPDIDPNAAANIIAGAIGNLWRQQGDCPDNFDNITRELERSLLCPANDNKDPAP
ncbi:TetR/AcrR family transcriptional regulator [Devosia rhodophyticola]|uniref:TetR/AcrR family transcriptional regulator n=1 Tax=Devosia rhodophyticola TaxID=3026423 RepID=A0ABY7YZP9_9HYPH|nr:TetR/AcrR family transcriptional regulator [Devosia rhodophyticola]WDR06722.1 TetR/AcrR family transcriptional regulator [Devosia rhodophyticola]